MLVIISKIPGILKKLRLDCGFTQGKLADFLGIDRSTYSYYESGKINPDVRTILNLSKIYGVDYTEILDADAEMVCSDYAKNGGKSSDDCINEDKYLKCQEKNISLGIKLLSKESRDEILKEISNKIKEERKSKKPKDWF